jgi:hypothetical protein
MVIEMMRQHRISFTLMVLMLLTLLSPIFINGTLDNDFDVQSLASEPIVFKASGEQEYELYLDEPNSQDGGDGSITTIEPSGSQFEGSAIEGLEFRSAEMIGNLYVNGSGSQNTARFAVYMQFRGSQGSSADVTFSLRAGDTEVASESIDLDSPCTSTFQSSCDWSVREVEFDLPSNGFQVQSGKQLKIRIDADATCEGSGGGPLGPDCAVDIGYGRMESSGGFSRLEIMTNPLAKSSVKVHLPGKGWNENEDLLWAPNHRADYRTMQFSVDVRDAFGRDDIEDVILSMWTPNNANTVFSKEFTDDDLKLDNDGLVGNFSYTYESGIAAGEYNIYLEIQDVQGHSVEFQHQGVEFTEHDIYLTTPSNQPDVVLIAPGQTTTVELLVEHIGSSSSSIEVEMDLTNNLPSSWSDPVWDKPGGYVLSGGGDYTRPILSITVPESDLTNVPSGLNIAARAYAEDTDGIRKEVRVQTIRLELEQVDVNAEPRVSIFEDEEQQIQIADSNRPEAYDETLSHYVDQDEVGTFFINVFNAGFVTDSFKIRILDLPDAWDYQFYDNDTGMELIKEGIYSVTPDIGSTQVMTVLLKLYPPEEREAQDIGLVRLSVTSREDPELTTQIGFTVHRTFGILAEIIADSDSGTLGAVGPVAPGAYVFYQIRVSDSSENTGSATTTWRIVNPKDLDRNIEEDTRYSSWDYDITDKDTGANLVIVNLAPEESVDFKLEINLRNEVPAGNHTIYLQIREENVEDDEARYFDLPLKIEVMENVEIGNLELTQKTENSPFAAKEEKNIDFRLTNQNNIELTVTITINEPDGWEAGLRATSDQDAAQFLILKLDPYSHKDFSMKIVAPESVKDNRMVKVEMLVTPMQEEVQYGDEYNQKFFFDFSTTCAGADCIFLEMIDPEPQTLVIYAILALCLLYAVFRRGQMNAQMGGDKYNLLGDSESGEGLMDEGNGIDQDWDEDLPPAVTQSTDDDDLELLDELDSI